MQIRREKKRVSGKHDHSGGPYQKFFARAIQEKKSSSSNPTLAPQEVGVRGKITLPPAHWDRNFPFVSNIVMNVCKGLIVYTFK